MNDKPSLKEQDAFIERVQTIEDFDEDTRCGFWIFKAKWMQKLASSKTFLVVHAFTGMIYFAGFNYYSGVITTLEKHYKFSSTQLSFISATYDVVGTFGSLIIPYYCSKGRFPRWMSFLMVCLAVASLIYTLPYFVYGPGKKALELTEEFDEMSIQNSTSEFMHQFKMKELCYENSEFYSLK